MGVGQCGSLGLTGQVQDAVSELIFTCLDCMYQISFIPVAHTSRYVTYSLYSLSHICMQLLAAELQDSSRTSRSVFKLS